MKNENASIHIGDKNKIKDCVIGSKIKVENTKLKKEGKWYSKFFWKLIIPIAVVVITTVICLWLGLT